MRHVPLILILLAGVTLALPASAQQPEGASDQPAEEADENEGEDGEPGEGTAEEAGTETTEPAPEESAPEVDDLESLRAEYFKLRDRLFQSRARASAVSSALYSTRLSVKLNYSSARYFTVTRATIRLDGANIFDDSEGSIASDKATRFEGYIAPGRHQVSIRIEATGKDDDRFTTVLDNSFIVQATKGKDLEVKARAGDDGSMAYSWSKKEKGSYRLHLDVSVKSVKRGKNKGNQLRRTGELRKHAPAEDHRS